MQVSRLSLVELAALVCSTFQKHGMTTVLTGGSCVTLYSEGKYVSKDIDLVLGATTDLALVEGALAELGFRRKGRAYAHPKVKYTVDVLPAPPTIGRERVRRPVARSVQGLRLLMLSPTDCVKDRLAAFFFWDDRQALKQALLVARAQRVNRAEIRRWARAERMTARLREFEAEMRSRTKAGE